MTLTPNASEEDKSRYRDACHEVQAKLRVMKDEWWDAKATKVQQGFADRHEEKEFYATLKEGYGPTHSATVPLKSSDGSALVTERAEILARCKQHFSDLLNTPSSIAQDAIDRIVSLPKHRTCHLRSKRWQLQSVK